MEPASQPMEEDENTWHPKLLALGFDARGPAPTPFVQAVLLSMRKYKGGAVIQQVINLEKAEVKKAVLANKETTLMTIIDSDQWFRFMVKAKVGSDMEVEKWLTEKTASLEQIAISDNNEVAGSWRRMKAYCDNFYESKNEKRPHVADIPEDQVHMMISPEDFSDDEQNVITDIQSKKIVSNQGCTDNSEFDISTWRFPIIPQRFIDSISPAYDFRLWTLPAITYEAPISISMWIKLASLAEGSSMDTVLNGLRDEALDGKILFDEKPWSGINIKQFDQGTCSWSCHVKVKKLQEYDFAILKWGWLRPFVKCNCGLKCKSKILWFDQAVWFILNHLGDFYSLGGPQQNLAAFLTYLQTPEMRLIIQQHIIHLIVREMMMEAAMQYGKDPSAKLLDSYKPCKAVSAICGYIRSQPNRNKFGEWIGNQADNSSTPASNSHTATGTPVNKRAKFGRGGAFTTSGSSNVERIQSPNMDLMSTAKQAVQGSANKNRSFNPGQSNRGKKRWRYGRPQSGSNNSNALVASQSNSSNQSEPLPNASPRQLTFT